MLHPIGELDESARGWSTYCYYTVDGSLSSFKPVCWALLSCMSTIRRLIVPVGGLRMNQPPRSRATTSIMISRILILLAHK